MKFPVLTIFYQFNPWNSSIGGIQTIINSFIKYAPSIFEIRVVGTCENTSEVGRWQCLSFSGRDSVNFLPIIAIKNDNERKFIPTTLRYTFALLGQNLDSDFVHFHRLEPSIATLNWRGNKTFFLHNDIQEQISSNSSKNSILWKHLPSGYFALEKSLIRQFDSIYSCNTKATQFYQEEYPSIAKKIAYLKNTVDTDIFYPLGLEIIRQKRRQLARQLDLSETCKFILFAGRLHPQKDPLLLIRSFGAIQDKNSHLLVAGDGELADAVRAKIRACGLSERVTLMGALKQQELVDLYHIASVFVLSSLYEGLPVSVLEALACGTPVVTTDCGETPKLLTPNSGLVTRERTPEAVADALNKVLQNPSVYSPSSCFHVAEPYTAKAVVSNVYQHMLALWEQKNSTVPV